MITLKARNFSHVVVPTIFPDNTSQVWKLPEEALERSVYTIQWHFENEAELFHVAQLWNLLRVQNAHEIHLEVPYLPYARQDKSVTNDSTFALLPFTFIIDKLEFDSVTCFDPHSMGFLERLTCKKKYGGDVTKFHNWVIKQSLPEIIFYPDLGAKARYSLHGHAWAEKVRDQATGQILSQELCGKPVKDKKVLIVDDIVDGGATFIGLTKKLLEAGAKQVDLCVSHGIFSKGIYCLQDAGINEIYTTNSRIHSSAVNLEVKVYKL